MTTTGSSAPKPKPRSRHAQPDGAICKECWPEGWPEDGRSAGCPHGGWTR